MRSITKKWYIVCTKPRCEKKVTELLSRKKIEHFCPLNKVQRQFNDRKKVVDEPLFSSYVFVHIDETEQIPVRLTDGIINFVYWLGRPAEVRNEEIQAIKEFLGDYKFVRLEKTGVNLQDKVRIIGGPLVTQVGQVVSVKNNRTIKLALPTLGYLMHAELASPNVELVREETSASFKKQQWMYAFR